MGAWIETTFVGFQIVVRSSHPTWVRGLKHGTLIPLQFVHFVAPYVGAWIETVLETISFESAPVAPYVGAWIETEIKTDVLENIEGRTLRGCVD